ncbi:hypothetical protein EB118_23385 [bacterium]|nr:hypothetical protein [bacterium]NDC95800.1 hypothetical protein [bacterium]NDD85466.1 hypothetical protein [bacterium]NDG32996.1 hypothetical protein [bacterium]
MTKVTKIHEYAVKYLHSVLQMETKTIAKEIGLTKKQVENVLQLSKNNSIPTNISSTDNELVLNKTQSNNKGVSIMTQAASTKGDEVIKNMGNVISRTARNAIFRPRGN